MDRRLTIGLVAMLVLACGGKSGPADLVQPVSNPLPTVTLAGQKVAVFPLTYLVAQESLEWRDAIGPREARLMQADSLIEEFLMERAPEVDWVFPDELRQAAGRAPGMLREPDRMGAAVLRSSDIDKVPSPLISHMRNLAAVVGDRIVLVPAALVFGEPIDTTLEGGMAEFTVSIVDVRQGLVRWHGAGYGVADDPWAAFRLALDGMVPIRP